ncbi:transporter substrate-binding domain-containing protein [Actinoplanes sp. NPDC051861]|uniref:transporter substrate-binding domain-containing protein n=1 Tax=Actinoplanes sp. NPDC051861 TaxID=3155170 RepID=UPI003438567E
MSPRTLPVVLLIVALVTSSCGKPASTAAGAEMTIRSGTLQIGSQQAYVPGEFRAEGSDELRGFGVEIAEEIAGRLGLTPEWVQSDYSALIAGLEAQRFDMGSGGMSYNPVRAEQVDMIGYFQSGATFLVRKTDEGRFGTGESMCGHRLGMIEGSTTLEKAVAGLNEKCGGKPIEIEYYTSTPLGLQGLLSERITAYAPDLAQARYIVEENPDQFATTGYHLVDYLINFTFRKGNAGNRTLRDAVYETLDGMIKDGTYGRILAAWDLESGALTRPAYNGDLSGRP